MIMSFCRKTKVKLSCWAVELKEIMKTTQQTKATQCFLHYDHPQMEERRRQNSKTSAHSLHWSVFTKDLWSPTCGFLWKSKKYKTQLSEQMDKGSIKCHPSKTPQVFKSLNHRRCFSRLSLFEAAWPYNLPTLAGAPLVDPCVDAYDWMSLWCLSCVTDDPHEGHKPKSTGRIKSK